MQKSKFLLPIAAAGVLCLGTSTAFADEELVSLQKYTVRDPMFNLPVQQIKVTAETDKIVVKGLTVNRGNCRAFSSYSERKKGRMVYGETIIWTTSVPNSGGAACNVREVIVHTDKGDVKFKFN